MITKNIKNIFWIEFDSLQGVKHGTLLRKGGNSFPPYDSLNFGFNCGDLDETVESNWQLFKDAFSIDEIKAGKQIHQSGVCEAGIDTIREYPNCDALMTNRSGIGLLIRHADCQACLLYDPINQAIANVHAGWRGLVSNIYETVIAAMRKRYGTNPGNLIAAISPSLCPDHAEFINYKKELPPEFTHFMLKPNHFDLWAIGENLLRCCGVENIETARICTYCNSRDFYSYRRDGITGRNGTFICL